MSVRRVLPSWVVWFTTSAAALTFAAPGEAQLTLRLVVSGLSEPLALVQDPLDTSVQFIVQKGGRIRVLKDGGLRAPDFLNLTASVSISGERGLLGLAFPPDHATSGRFFVNFTNLQGHTVIARFTRSTVNPLVADAASRFDLRWPGGQRFITQPHSNHNGGTLRFGPDGYLYIGMGDGGSANDPGHRAQDPNSLLGKMLRIDVDVADDNARGYRVPADNPFLDGLPVSALGEIWAFGLRNPWKFSFDEPARGGTGGLFIGDVGQSSREEIDFEPAGSGGRNYGWRNREGTIAGGALPVLPPAYTPLTPPIYDYPRTAGRSVTGGFVYRGSRLAATYRGRYFFADFPTGRVASLGLTYSGAGEAIVSNVSEHTAELGGAETTGRVSSIDQDAAGELYVVDFRGSIRRIEPAVPLTMNISGSGQVTFTPSAAPCTTSCVRVVVEGSLVALKPTAASGWAFAGWSGDADCLDGRLTMSIGRVCRATFVPTLQSTRSIVDFNGDGRSDVFTYDSTAGAWSMDMSGVRRVAGSLQGSWAASWVIKPGDFNNDGLTDLFLYNVGTGQWFRAVRAPTGDFTYTNGTWRAGWDVHVLDLTGDGRADVFLYDAASGLWFKCRTTSGADFSYVSGTWEPGWQVYPAELDGNRVADLFLYRSATGEWVRAMNDGAAGWVLSDGTWRAGWEVHVADFNGDRRSDVFLYDPGTGQWFLCTNVAGGFRYVTGTWAAGWTVRMADLNADGRADVFLYNQTTGVWFECVTRTSGFSYATGNWVAGWDVYITDLNGDGRSDVLLYRPSTGVWFRCLNTGFGVFSYSTGTWEPNRTIVATTALPG